MRSGRGGRRGKGRSASAAAGRDAVRGGEARVAGGAGATDAAAAGAHGGEAVPGVRAFGARLRARAVHRVPGVAAGGLQLQRPGVVPVVRCEAGAFELDAPGGSLAASGVPAVDADVAASAPMGGAQAAFAGEGGGATAGARGVEVSFLFHARFSVAVSWRRRPSEGTRPSRGARSCPTPGRRPAG